MGFFEAVPTQLQRLDLQSEQVNSIHVCNSTHSNLPMLMAPRVFSGRRKVLIQERGIDMIVVTIGHEIPVPLYSIAHLAPRGQLEECRCA